MEEYTRKDLIVQAFSNNDFPAQYVATMTTPGLENVTITSFYEAFCKKNGFPIQKGTNVIFQPATVLGYLFCSFLLPQQEYFNEIPKIIISENDWGINIDKDRCLNLNHIAKRLRNALAHNRIKISKDGIFTFWDAKPDKKNFLDAEVIYRFDFDGLMFKFLPKWNEVLLDIFTKNEI